MLNKEQIAIAALDYGDKKPEGAWATLHFLAGANWANKQESEEIAELVKMLQEVLVKSPAGSQYPHWSDFRAEIAQKLKKYEQSA